MWPHNDQKDGPVIDPRLKRGGLQLAREGCRVWRYDSRPAANITQRYQAGAVVLIEGKYVIREPTPKLEVLVGLELNGELGLCLFDER
jgi:hypothetical protein